MTGDAGVPTIPSFPTLPANPTPQQSAQFLAAVEAWTAAFDAIKTAISQKGDAVASAANKQTQVT
jgi:hypothetical protein